MNQIKAIKSIPIIIQEFDQLKTSIDSNAKQLTDYDQNYKRYEKKDFSIQKRKKETFEQAITRAETLLDLIYDLGKRNKLIIETVNELIEKLDNIKTTLKNLKF